MMKCSFAYFAAGLLLSMGMAAGTASASTVLDFRGPFAISPTFTVGPLTLTGGAAGILNGGSIIDFTPSPADLCRTASGGIGVSGAPDLQPCQIDGSPILSAESITGTFTSQVILEEFELGNVDADDDFFLSLDNGPFSFYSPGFVNPVLVGQPVNSFTIVTIGLRQPSDTETGGDDFTLVSVTISPVPVPASVVLLFSGLAGMVALKRLRRRRAIGAEEAGLGHGAAAA